VNTSQSQSTRTLEQLRYDFIRILSVLGTVIGGIGIVPVLLIGLQEGRSLVFLMSPVLVAALSGLALWLVERHVRWAGILICLTLTLATFTPPPALLVLALTAVLASAVLANRVAYIAINAFIFVRFLFVAAGIINQDPGNLVAIGGEVMAPLLTLAITSLTTRYFFSNVESFAQNVIKTAGLLETTAQVGELVNRELDLKTLLTQSVEFISNRFGYYHVQVFLVDDAKINADLVASTGTVGRLLLDRKHKLAVGSRSVIGRVTASGQYVIARDDDPDNVRFRNELLPETRAELALPLLDGEVVIGALDVQSKQIGSFSEREVQALQVLANLLSTAIRNARSFARQLQISTENERLLAQSQDNLEEIRRLNRQLTGQAWRDFIKTEDKPEAVTLLEDSLQMTADWTEHLRQAATGKPVVKSGQNGTLVALPLMLRGEVIGAVEIETDGNVISTEDMDDIQELLEHLTISLENARLYEVAQAATATEARLNQITARYEQVSSVDELLRVTLNELSDTLGARAGAIRLGQMPVEHANGENRS